MIDQNRVDADGKEMERVMKPYSGNDGAHFGLIGTEDYRRYFCIGGRVDLLGTIISEGLARMVFITPELDERYIDIVADTAREMLARMKGGAN